MDKAANLQGEANHASHQFLMIFFRRRPPVLGPVRDQYDRHKPEDKPWVVPVLGRPQTSLLGPVGNPVDCPDRWEVGSLPTVNLGTSVMWPCCFSVMRMMSLTIFLVMPWEDHFSFERFLVKTSADSLKVPSDSFTPWWDGTDVLSNYHVVYGICYPPQW